MKALNLLLEKAKKDKEVLGVLVFGSFARKEKYSDIDICLILQKKLTALEMSRKRLEYLTEFPNIDIQIFQQLPLYIKARVIKEGRVLLCKNNDLLYDIAIRNMKDFEGFRHVYKTYLEGVLHG